MTDKKTSRLLTSPYIAWAVIFVLVPLVLVFYYGSDTRFFHAQ